MPDDYNNNQQQGSDGYGYPKTVYGRVIRVFAKELTQTRPASIRITGLSTGATWNILFQVQPGVGMDNEVTEFDPLPIL